MNGFGNGFSGFGLPNWICARLCPPESTPVDRAPARSISKTIRSGSRNKDVVNHSNLNTMNPFLRSRAVLKNFKRTTDLGRIDETKVSHNQSLLHNGAGQYLCWRPNLERTRFWNWKTLTSACIIGRMKPCQTSQFRTMVAPDRPGLR